MNNLHPAAHPEYAPKSLQSLRTAFARAERAISLQKISTCVFLVWFVAALIYTLGTIALTKEPYTPVKSDAFMIPLFLFIAFKTSLGLRINWLFARNHFSEAIERTDDPKDLGCLLDVIDAATTRARPSLLSEERVPDATHYAVKRALRQVDAEDLSALNSRQRTQLYKLLLPAHDLNLERRYDPQLALILLNVIERVRVHDALPYARQLAKRSDTPMEIRAAAQQCLTCLEKSLAQQQTNKTLLRPSTASTPPDMLLRCAIDTKQSASEATEQLLRSSASGALRASNDSDVFLPDFELPTQPEPVQQVQIGKQAEENTP